jgi:hypothetical protein
MERNLLKLMDESLSLYINSVETTSYGCSNCASKAAMSATTRTRVALSNVNQRINLE